MRRRDFVLVVLGASIAARPAAAQNARKTARIGIVHFASETNDTIVGFAQGLKDLGYVEGRNLAVVKRFAEGHSERLAAQVAEVLASGVDVLYAPGTQAALAAKRQTTTVPIVFISSDPIAGGLVQNLARPGGNVTGLSVVSGEYSAKWLELLKEAVPRLRRIALLYNPDNTLIAGQVERMRRATPRLGVELLLFSVLPQDIDSSLVALPAAGVDGLVLPDDALVQALTPRLAAFAAAQHLPGIAGSRGYVQAGLLMSYAVDLIALGRRAAAYVDRILQGARPADLPVEQATDFQLTVNLAAAKALGIEIPLSLVARAQEVIE